MTNFLKDLIKEGEGSTVEFKKTISSAEKIAKTLCSFANSKGGYILVGVADNKVIVGAEAEEEKYVLMQSAEFYCHPPVSLEFDEAFGPSGEQILLAYVPESGLKPHALKDESGTEKVYVRSGAHCLLAAPSVVKALKNEYKTSPAVTAIKPNKNVQALFKYLATKNKITVKDYAKLINVSRNRAKVILRNCLLEGLLYEHDFEKENFYTLAKK